MTIPAFINSLATQLSQPLPGLSAQVEMASMRRGGSWDVRDDHRKSGVLALLYPHLEELQMVFMKRTEDGRVHSGQVSFPGGKMEPSDSDSTFTALREAHEELGILPDSVKVLGQLTELYIPPSNFMVYPTVGFSAQRPDFLPEPGEVAEIIEVPVRHLLNPDTRQEVKVKVAQGMKVQAPAFVVNDHIIWGATSMMLNELLTIIRRLDQ
ncbi:CoA pyrophosphatase [Pontibacter sp. G13]|uniref:NUDIX hydrolase n=1 Tax=Pontibacter sp. G13 TaxID=3074898 RepID=UPI00288A79D3|nr:CoA pyrophosphatase [Pontibacter sp. G13]WNJ16290.1 CoA pyrophosphatase [Pontibacter sp. G13]